MTTRPAILRPRTRVDAMIELGERVRQLLAVEAGDRPEDMATIHRIHSAICLALAGLEELRLAA